MKVATKNDTSNGGADSVTLTLTAAQVAVVQVALTTCALDWAEAARIAPHGRAGMYYAQAKAAARAHSVIAEACGLECGAELGLGRQRPEGSLADLVGHEPARNPYDEVVKALGIISAQDPDETVKRSPGCACTFEEGDSPCPVHGMDEPEGAG